MRHIILTLRDAQALAQLPAVREALPDFARRMHSETGARMTEIVKLLKSQAICGACASEGQAQHCNSIEAKKLGRRLSRLVDRAGPSVPSPEEQELLDAGWLPVSLGALERESAAYAGDWTPPEDRGNFWDFDRAVAECRKRKAKGTEP